MRFSQRQGLTEVRSIAQTGGMDDVLRNSLWNALTVCIWETPYFKYSGMGELGDALDQLSQQIWVHFFKKPLDRRPSGATKILDALRAYFFGGTWYEVYDFIEHVVAWPDVRARTLVKVVNQILDLELAGYRLIDGHIVEVTDELEVTLLSEALRDTRYAAPTAHLRRALEMLARRVDPDYRNSIKESISAVEAMAKILAPGKPKATLNDAVMVLEKQKKLHPALREGFSKLYGYTNDADGIRHAMMDEPDLTLADARYFLLSCTSFVNYLKTLA